MPATYLSIKARLREHYHKNGVRVFIEGDNPMLSPFVAGLMRRNDIKDAMGKGYVIPITSARGSGVSNDFATARAISQGSSGSATLNDAWTITPVTKNALAHWDRDAILSAEGPGELFNIMTTEIDARLSKMKVRLAIDLFEAGYGRAATITAAPTSSTVKVSRSTFNRFEVGDHLVAAQTLSGALRSETALVITGIDEDAFTLTLSGDPTALSWANGDTLFFKGDHTANTLTSVAGMDFWLPSTAPSDTVFGVTRTGNPALGGRRFNRSSYDMLTGLMRQAEYCTRVGIVPKEVFVSIEDFGNMAVDKERVKIEEISVGEFKIGFGVAKLLLPTGGVVAIKTEMMMEQGRDFMGDFSSEHAPFLAHNGDLINVDDFSGNELKDVDGATQYEQRWFLRGNLCFPGTGKFVRGHSIPA
jgi:hypothetical protein